MSLLKINEFADKQAEHSPKDRAATASRVVSKDPPASTSSNNEDEMLDELLNDGGYESDKAVQEGVELVPSEDLYEQVDDSGSLPDKEARAVFEEDYEMSRVEQLRSIGSQSPETSPTHSLSKRDFIEEIGYGTIRQGKGIDDNAFKGKHEDRPTGRGVFTEGESPPEDTSTTALSDYSQNHGHANLEIQELQIVDDGFRSKDDGSSVSSMQAFSGEEEQEDEVDEENDASATSDVSEDAAALLERAHDRIARQNLQEEVKSLKDVIERKNAELESLAGQLRRAVETKCDLVVAHNELEKSHEKTVQKKNENLMRMKEANKCLLEGHAATEKKMLNELIRLNDKLASMEKKHNEELDDWERMHRNEMLEKDYQIAKLTEELRTMRLTASVHSGRPQFST